MVGDRLQGPHQDTQDLLKVDPISLESGPRACDLRLKQPQEHLE